MIILLPPFNLSISCFYKNFNESRIAASRLCLQITLIFFHESIRLLYDTLMEVPVKVRAIIKLLENDGWFMDRTKGGHRQFKHSAKSGLVTVSGKLSDELASGTQNSIFKQAGYRK